MWSRITIYEKILTRMISISASCACKNKSLVPCSRMSKPLKKVKLEMWFDGENEYLYGMYMEHHSSTGSVNLNTELQRNSFFRLAFCDFFSLIILIC